MRSAVAMALAVALLTVSGCGPSSPKTVPGGIGAVATDQGLEVRASVAAATFAPGAVPAVSVEVRNTGKNAVRYIRYDGCDKGFHVWMEQGGSRTGYFVETSDNPPRGCNEAIQFNDLQPGAIIATTYVYRAVPDMPPPPNGGQAIKVSFNRAAGIDAVQPLVVALNVTVQGGEARATAAEALNAARADDRVALWLKAHPETPLTTARWRDGRWQVQFATKTGPTPREVEVAVGGVPAKVVSVTWR